MIRALITVVTFLLLTAGAALSQIPRQIGYQGVLTDTAGQLVPDGDHSLTMTLYSEATGGSALWTETQTVTVVRGTFNVIMGRSAPIPGTVSFDRACFLGVSVDAGAELAPRAALTAAPYALRSAVAEGLTPTATGAVRTLNGADGDMTIVGSGSTTVARVGTEITITSTSDSGALMGVQNIDGSINITAPNGPIATVSVADGGVTLQKISAAGATPGKALTFNGSDVVWGTPTSNFTLPFDGIDTSSVSSLGILQRGAGSALRGQIDNGAATVAAIEGSTNANTAAIAGRNTATTGGATYGVLGEASSTTNGVGANGGVSGVLGRVVGVSPGGYSAGVRGLNQGTGGTGIGVIGYQGGSGWGVYGETPSGFGVYGLTTNSSAASSGVRGETFSTNGIGVESKYSGTGVGIALEIDNGGIRVAGTNKAAFVHTATVANKISSNGTDITNPMCDGDANAILIVTQKLNPTGTVYNNSPIGVYYNAGRGKWEIFNENNAAIPTNAQFNVLVINQ